MVPAVRRRFVDLIPWIAAFSCVVFATSNTMADGSSNPNDAQAKHTASKLLDEGNRLSNEGEYVEALEKFRAAHEIYPSPKLLLNIGTMLRQLGRNVEAAEIYEKYLSDPQSDPKQREFLTRTLDEIDSLVGHVRVTVDPKDAVVSLDGTALKVRSEGANVRVEPGTHKIAGEKKGFPPALATISIKRGETRDVELRLAPLPVVVKSSPLQVGGIVSLSIGALGFIGAGITGAMIMSAHEQYAQDCPYRKCTTAVGYEAALSGQTLLTVNAVAWGVGIAGAGVGTALLILTHKKPKPAEQSLVLGPGFIGLQGNF